MKNYREVQIERCNWRHPETVHVCGYIRNLRNIIRAVGNWIFSKIIMQYTPWYLSVFKDSFEAMNKLLTNVLFLKTLYFG